MGRFRQGAYIEPITSPGAGWEKYLFGEGETLNALCARMLLKSRKIPKNMEISGFWKEPVRRLCI
ncbi:hypothetical protein NITGR_1020004 [Nitrospina gracilis 3/211]|uniref:Uncharacterized protein n=1 Tax=Nitrospina gracilis (strain 3/211) TaxID=1266370 RepID=M1YFW8_NITG3|nr:hypothetical protein NITGR_1020004 [Nitrospina gracilis 3/211]